MNSTKKGYPKSVMRKISKKAKQKSRGQVRIRHIGGNTIMRSAEEQEYITECDPDAPDGCRVNAIMDPFSVMDPIPQSSLDYNSFAFPEDRIGKPTVNDLQPPFYKPNHYFRH